MPHIRYKVPASVNLVTHISYCIQATLTKKKFEEQNNDLEESSNFVSESDDSLSDSDDDDVYISDYEKAALKRKEENCQLMKKLQIYRVSGV